MAGFTGERGKEVRAAGSDLGLVRVWGIPHADAWLRTATHGRTGRHPAQSPVLDFAVMAKTIETLRKGIEQVSSEFNV